MTILDKPEVSDLSLVPVDADIGKCAASIGYDGGFSLLEPKEADFNPAETLFRSTAKRDDFQEFTFG